MKKFLAVILMMVSISAFANDRYLSMDGLTEQQKAELSLQAAKMKTAHEENISTTVRKEAEAWGEMGTNMGRAVVGAAKELGIAANEFAQTPLGKVTVGVVVYKVIGEDVLSVAIGSFVLFVGVWLGIWLMTRWRLGCVVKYDYKPFLFGLWQRKVVLEIDDTRGDIAEVAIRVIFGAACIILSVIVGLTTIF